MRGKLRIGAAILALLAVFAGGAALYVHRKGWNWARGPLAHLLSARLGRTVTLAGDLDIDLGWRPAVTANAVAIANAPWAKPAAMFAADRVALRMRLLPLLAGRFRFESAELDGATLVLERNGAGESNWPSRRRGPKRALRVSLPREFRFADSRLIYVDRKHERSLDFEFDRLLARGEENADYTVSGRGRYNGHPLAVAGLLGPWEIFWENASYPLRLDAVAGDTRARLSGRLAKPRQLDGLSGTLSLRGQSLDELWQFFELPLAETPPYRVTGRFTRDGHRFGLHDFDGVIGHSDLRGSLAVDLRPSRRPLLRADLRSRRMEVADFKGFWGARPRSLPTTAPGPVFPDRPYSFAKLRAMDADVAYRAARVSGQAWLESIRLSLGLVDGRLALRPLDLGFAGGRLISRATIDARGDVATLAGAMELESIDLERLLARLHYDAKAAGTFGGRARLTTRGNSLREMASHLDGELGFVMADGRLGETALELVAVDLGEALVAELWGDKQAPVRCAIGTFAVNDGRMEARTLLLDSDDVRITGEGTIDLARERMDLTLHQHPKDFSIGTLRSPIDIEGGLRTRQAHVRKSGLVRRAGAALALGALVNPIAALLPLVELGRGEKPGACEAALADLRRIAPPEPQARERPGRRRE